MSYLEFFIRIEHNFIRKVLEEEQLKKYETRKSLTLYLEAFQKVLLADNINNSTDFDQVVDSHLKHSCGRNCAELSDFTELIDEI